MERKATTWEDTRILDPEAWKTFDFTPDEAAQWEAAGVFSAAEASMLRDDRGLTPEDFVKYGEWTEDELRDMARIIDEWAKADLEYRSSEEYAYDLDYVIYDGDGRDVNFGDSVIEYLHQKGLALDDVALDLMGDMRSGALDSKVEWVNGYMLSEPPDRGVILGWFQRGECEMQISDGEEATLPSSGETVDVGDALINMTDEAFSFIEGEVSETYIGRRSDYDVLTYHGSETDGYFQWVVDDIMDFLVAKYGPVEDEE